MAHADGDDGERSGARAGGIGHDCEAEGSDRSERAACVREVHGEQQHRGESVHRNVSHECVPDLAIFLVRSSEGHSAGSREQVWSASVGRVGISAWGLGLVVGVERKNWPRNRH
jgi:hypothetical protein